MQEINPPDPYSTVPNPTAPVDPYSTVPSGSAPVALNAPPLEAHIRHYRIDGELGRGAMGVVYRAQDEQLQRTVALKLLLGQDIPSCTTLQRFRAEAEILAHLQHPNIVQVFEIGDHQGSPFFAMEYVAGTTLQDKVRENPLPPTEAARLVHLLAEAMHFAHDKGIIHRDLKPSNVLLSQDQVPKIADFGLARKGRSEMTTPGAAIGTPSYMAPEQALGDLERIGPATDVYSLGAILFELLSGRAPFRGATIHATLQLVLNADPPSPRRLQPGVPRDLETICLKCLQKDPAKRYASAKALADDLQRFLRGEAILARPIGPLESLAKWARREKKVAFLAAVVLAVSVIGFAAVVFLWQAERSMRQDRDEQLYLSRITVADRELAADKVAWAQEALAKCPESLRDWEWRHLAERCQHAEATKLDLSGAVISLAAHPERTAVVVGCSNGQFAILDDDKIKQGPFPAHLGSINWLTFTPDGAEFFSGGEDGQIHGWKVSSAEKTTSFLDHEGPISCLAAHPREPWIASTTFDGPDSGTVFVWHRATGKRIFTLKNHTSRVTGLAFDPTGQLLASASHDQTITLWNGQTGDIVRVLTGHHLPIACVAFSPDGALLASSAGRVRSFKPGEDEIFVWDVAAGKLRHHLSGHTERAVTLAFAPSGTRLASAGWDHQVKIWELRTGQEVLTLSGHKEGIMALAFNRNEFLFTGGLDKAVRVWKTAP